MHKITIIAVGKLKEPFWQAACGEYEKRIGQFAKFAVVEVIAEPTGPTTTGVQSMAAEGARILSRLPDDAVVIALERTGKELSSVEFSALIDDVGGSGMHVAFVIGGAEGLDAPVLARAQRKVSLSKMTLVHEMARAFLLEQIYRGEMILHGRAYHR